MAIPGFIPILQRTDEPDIVDGILLSINHANFYAKNIG